ncbi:hypothetical protein KJE20_03506 [Pyrenophora tritici-repentis]|uniref:Uncharacterized protein n=2 Tax=Pyrenophora tritici-repentis TaxID=45151 RepID=A0A922SPV6_9PLEO|nr:hypothetical protein Ptr86124_012902 [Pyrenophora tritici-repentis]KAI1690328.1 hypothetical protein KJE20_03506 [Pyrenophora tritici-repentis]
MQIDTPTTSLPEILTLDVGGTRTFRTTKQVLATAPIHATPQPIPPLLDARLENEADFFLLQGLRNWIHEHEPRPQAMALIKEEALTKEARSKQAMHIDDDDDAAVIQTLIVKGGLRKKFPSAHHDTWNTHECEGNHLCEDVLECMG